MFLKLVKHLNIAVFQEKVSLTFHSHFHKNEHYDLHFEQRHEYNSIYVITSVLKVFWRFHTIATIPLDFYIQLAV
jgi:hypothetical protein